MAVQDENKKKELLLAFEKQNKEQKELAATIEDKIKKCE
jgi:hypothetical protein